MEEVTSHFRFRVTGMDCAGCAAKIDAAVRRVDGVSDVTVSATAGTLRGTSTGNVRREVEVAVKALGYGITPVTDTVREQQTSGADTTHDAGTVDEHGHGASFHGAWWQSAKARLTMTCAVALTTAYLLAKLVPSIGPAAFVAAMAVGLMPIATRAIQAARVGQPFTIETLMTIAAIGAVFIGAAEEAAMVVLLFLIGELLEGVAAGRARAPGPG
jgi:Cd2+/Zn2+-exporting ATPase